jgi:ABC-type lipoprotein export system ATPase subunit
MKSYYKGMCWLKCDLQMQTPADSRHWQGDRFETDQEASAAEAFADACYETGLSIVGITDHNFLSKDFIPHLQSAFEKLERERNHKVTLFPGFEFEAAGVGRGVHILCLFEPGADLAHLDAILTECGITYPRVRAQDGQLAKSDKNLKDILRIVQEKHTGIVIMPHAMSNDGIFDDDSISNWLQQDQFINPELLAIEVPRPVHLMSAGYQRLLKSGDDCQLGWKRIRPMATLMSSDNKKLIDVDLQGVPSANSIGYRYSWIKMSAPSIESLRQAFLDHQSRIKLPEDVVTDVHPALRVRQAIIRSISIKNVAFLGDQEVYFSPNMSCVIGGRGSGKSTLLEYLRIIFGKDNVEDIDEDTKKRINRVRDTLKSPGAELEVTWVSAEGVEDRIVWQGGQPIVQRDDMHDPDTFFQNLPISFFSQQQLNRLTESKGGVDGQIPQAQRLLELVDGFAKNDLSGLGDEERKLKLKIQASFTSLRRAKALNIDLKKIQQEYQELDRQWKARSEIQADAIRHQKLKSESFYIETILGEPGTQFSDVVELADSVARSHASFQIEGAPHSQWFEQFDAKVKQAKEDLAKNITQKVEQYRQTIESFKAEDPTWTPIQHEIVQADAKFSQACENKGLTPDDVGHLKEVDQSRTKKQQEIIEVQGEVRRLQHEAGDPEELVQQLHLIWQQQFEKRLEAANRANELAILTEENRQFIEVTVQYQFDQTNFFDLWHRFGPKDGRTALSRSWRDIGLTLMDKFIKIPDCNGCSPWELLRRLYHDDGGKEAISLFFEQADNLKQHIKENIEDWDQLRLSRVKDVVDLKLFRHDGTVAGSISEGSLSDGQRNTAALALLLAQNGGPLVIDQPEDELDSNFVFKELIPMLRKVKVGRQIILSTHNANLPVNGDAELIYALEAKDGKGVTLAEGGLDKTDVTSAVLDIMEGTEEAFRRRREKYHF